MEQPTHEDLSTFGMEYSVLDPRLGNRLARLGLDAEQGLSWHNANKKPLLFVQDGAVFEDYGDIFRQLTGESRSYNHFHNALRRRESWSEAGLDDVVVLRVKGIPVARPIEGESTALWAQDRGRQAVALQGDWSWQAVRDAYHCALWPGSDVECQGCWARTFRGLGHQMHLVQDMAVPTHVRNDGHPGDSLYATINGVYRFEKWAERNPLIINTFATAPIFPTLPMESAPGDLAPIAWLIDGDVYDGTNPARTLDADAGLAEYTNANFFSEDTIFAAERYATAHRHYFPYPRASSTDIEELKAHRKPPELVELVNGKVALGLYVSKTGDGEQIAHLARLGLFTLDLWSLLSGGELLGVKSFYHDEICHRDYMAKLVPRAVGYSATLLNYFFRGDLHVAMLIPSSDGANLSFDNRTDTGFDIDRVAVLVQNSSRWNGRIEPIDSGVMTLTVSYTDAGSGERLYRRGSAVPVAGIPDVDSGEYLPVVFVLESPVAVSAAAQIKYHLAFRGRLGAEQGAVAGRVIEGPLLYGVEPERGRKGTAVLIQGDRLPQIPGPYPAPAEPVRFSHHKEAPYTVVAQQASEESIRVAVPDTAALEKPGYGGLRVRTVYDSQETVFSNPLPFFPLAVGMVEHVGTRPALVTISAVKPTLGDYGPLPPSQSFPLAPGESTALELTTGFTYQFQANTTQRADILKLTPQASDFHIEVE
jgi:hypothetical protein